MGNAVCSHMEDGLARERAKEGGRMVVLTIIRKGPAVCKILGVFCHPKMVRVIPFVWLRISDGGRARCEGENATRV